MKRRYVYDKAHDKMVEVTEIWSPPLEDKASHHIMPDIKPYKSMITGEEITSRSKHREHLKQHGCVEVGNEVDYMVKNRIRPEAPPGLREQLLRAGHKHGVFKS